MKQSLWFIINPKSGNSKKQNLEKQVRQYLNSARFDISFHYTQYVGHGNELGIEAVEKKIDIVCAVGGDGSVHEISTAILGSNTKLAILPLGSGNGIARHLGIPSKTKEALQTIQNGLIQKVDVFQCGDQTGIGFGGFGFDAFIAKEFKGSTFRGFWKYVYLILKHYFSYRALHFNIQHGKETIQGKFLVVSIANASQYGNGFVISSRASMSDGELVLVLIKPFPWFMAFSIVWHAFTKQLHRSRYVNELPFREIILETDGVWGQIDGEVIKINSPISLKVIPHNLNVIVPYHENKS
ncbi:MAG: diacylglycerol/lipid kinase family protein [Flavobacteriales bacterium]